MVTHSYDGFNRLISSVVGTTTITYTYNPQGIRTSRTVGTTTTQYLLDGGNVVGEVTDGTVTTYLRGANLISNGTSYYLYNAHGDVVQLTDSTGAVTTTYEYDAFGNEKNPSDTDANSFRYCGEYYDTETGLYYLRARYYDPTVGRFTQEDTHWNTANMIYGDNPQKINEREDALGLKTYSYAPQILSILQAGNLYIYTINNPLRYHDESGEVVEEDCIQEDPEEMLIPDKDAIGAPNASAQGPTAASGLAAGTSSQTINPVFRKFIRANFRFNLQKYTGTSGKGLEAHHILPVRFFNNFDAIGIKIHKPEFGAWVNPTAHRSWSHAYNQAWLEFFKATPTPTLQMVYQKAIELAEQYGYTLNLE